MIKYLYRLIMKILKAKSMFSIYPKTNYQKYIPKSAEDLMRSNWEKIIKW